MLRSALSPGLGQQPEKGRRFCAEAAPNLESKDDEAPPTAQKPRPRWVDSWSTRYFSTPDMRQDPSITATKTWQLWAGYQVSCFHFVALVLQVALGSFTSSSFFSFPHLCLGRMTLHRHSRSFASAPILHIHRPVHCHSMYSCTPHLPRSYIPGKTLAPAHCHHAGHPRQRP